MKKPMPASIMFDSYIETKDISKQLLNEIKVFLDHIAELAFKNDMKNIYQWNQFNKELSAGLGFIITGMQKNVKSVALIEEMIQDLSKHMDKKGICWLCYESSMCYHQYQIDILNSLKEKLE